MVSKRRDPCTIHTTLSDFVDESVHCFSQGESVFQMRSKRAGPTPARRVTCHNGRESACEGIEVQSTSTDT
jgi:hypothetical protein